MSPRTPSTARPLRARMILAALAVTVAVIAVFNIEVVPTDEVAAVAVGDFDPSTYAADAFEDIAATVDDDALDLPALLADLADGADEAEFGNTSGASSAFAFPVTFDAVAGTVIPPVLPVTVDGVPPEVTVQVQVGPALNGTALRDVTGTISFNEFSNQLEYQNVGTALNDIARDSVLSDFDAAAAAGKTIRVTGAFLRVNPNLVSVVPVSIEVVG